MGRRALDRRKLKIWCTEHAYLCKDDPSNGHLRLFYMYDCLLRTLEWNRYVASYAGELSRARETPMLVRPLTCGPV